MKKIILTSVLASLALFATSAQASLADLLPENLVNAAGETVSRDSLEGKIIGLYFSAEWCPPCRGFTPTLVKFRDANADQFEVVFVSSDRSAADQKKYMTGYKMQFPAVEHGSPAGRALSERFSIRGIPALIILDAEGNTISTNGRGELSSDAGQALSLWKSKAG